MELLRALAVEVPGGDRSLCTEKVATYTGLSV
jgi:hypothetical protein